MTSDRRGPTPPGLSPGFEADLAKRIRSLTTTKILAEMLFLGVVRAIAVFLDILVASPARRGRGGRKGRTS